MRFIYLLILLIVSLVLYLSWMPDPHLGKAGFVPDWLASWGDMEEFRDIRTGVPLILLGYCAGLLPIVGPSQNIARWLATWLLLTALVTLAEVGQLLLPERAFSWADIGWGAMGALLGLTLAAITKDVRFKV
ncbi:hypothetical protein [Spirosoma validum]|uniref:VanZ family protein n=1 Tax=Spirosoma validum TaxID=2771355 RepID=A0A927GEY0_9BACT|nr:hypothetical protein [Spirosoma validum]MBD2755153.1 hypothetical protein [Spirosoma validum]